MKEKTARAESGGGGGGGGLKGVRGGRENTNIVHLDWNTDNVRVCVTVKSSHVKLFFIEGIIQ